MTGEEKLLRRDLLSGVAENSPTAFLRTALYESLGSLGLAGMVRLEIVRFASEGIAAAIAGGPEAVLTVAVHDGRYAVINGGPLMLDIDACETVTEMPAVPALSLVANVTEITNRMRAAMQRSDKDAGPNQG